MWTWKGKGTEGWKSKPDRNSISLANLFENSTLEHVWDVMTALWLYVICGWIELRFCTEKANWHLWESKICYTILSSDEQKTSKIPTQKSSEYLTKLKAFSQNWKFLARLMSTPSVWSGCANEMKIPRLEVLQLVCFQRQSNVHVLLKSRGPLFFEGTLCLVMVY